MLRFFTESDRLEAFSDGVIAVIITIMVLELRPPDSTAICARCSRCWPTFAAYALSFTFVGIYWNNHHHMLQRDARHRRQRDVGEPASAVLALARAVHHGVAGPKSPRPTGRPPLYGAVLLLDAIAYTILQRALRELNGRDAPFSTAVKTDAQGRRLDRALCTRARLRVVWPLVSDVIFVVRRPRLVRPRPPLRAHHRRQGRSARFDLIAAQFVLTAV